VIVRGGRIALVVYLGICLVISLLQESLIFPGASTQGEKSSMVRPSGGEELVHLKTSDGIQVCAIFGKAMSADGVELADANTQPTILFFYGNGMCMADCEGEFQKFRRLGFNAMIPDFVGYGMSGGRPSEQGVYATAECAYAYLSSRGDIDAKKIVPTGWSLGAAAAIEIAAKHPGPGLVTMSAFTSMTDMARKVLPFFPASLLLKHRFENEAKLRGITCPVLIFHGTRDSIIPFEMSARLEKTVKGSAERVPVVDADHNDLFEVGGEEMFGRIGEFVLRVTGG
jgi:uncharacterized protein